MTPKEIRKLQRHKRSQPVRIREAISRANAIAFSAPVHSQRKDGAAGEARWAERWSASFDEAKAHFSGFTDADMTFFLTGRRP